MTKVYRERSELVWRPFKGVVINGKRVIYDQRAHDERGWDDVDRVERGAEEMHGR